MSEMYFTCTLFWDVITLPMSLFCFLHAVCVIVSKQIEKVPRGIQGEKSSKDMASSGNLVSTIAAHASLKKGDETRCTEG